MNSLSVELATLLILILFSAFFSGSETAIFSLAPVDLNRIKKSMPTAHHLIIKGLAQPRDFLITVLFFNEVINVSISILVSVIVYSFLGSDDWQKALLYSIMIATPILLVLCDILPKNIAIRLSRQIVPIIIFPMTFFSIISKPFRRPLVFLSDKMITLFGGDILQYRTMIMEDEFRKLIDMGEETGAVAEEEAELIHGVFELSDCTVKEIMTPRGEVFSVPSDKPLEDILSDVKTTQFFRIPVYGDNPNVIIGVIYVKDLLALRKLRGRGHSPDLEGIIRPALYVDRNLKLDAMLKEFQRRKIHIAIVEDSFGAFIGVVTMDDILEKLLGEREEDDHV